MPARRGEDYLESIRQRQPTVFYDGRVIDDVTTHPATRGAVATLAGMYDLQGDPGYRDKLTYELPDTGERVGISFLIPRSADDLARLGDGLATIYDHMYGFFGRCFDYLNLWTSVFAAHGDDFFGQPEPRFGRNVVNYHRHCRDHDAFLSHAIVAPSVDRSKPASRLDDPFNQVRVVSEGGDGIVVRGAAMVCTAAPYAEEMIYLPNMLRDPDPGYALAFACDTNTAGLKFIARRSFAPRPGCGPFEYPISARFEESDAFVVFDDAVIPWDRVFVFKDAQKIPLLMWQGVAMKAWFSHHFNIQHHARLKFLTGLAVLIAKTVGIDGFINVQEKLGELLIHLNLTRASVIAAQAAGTTLPNGLFRPNAQIAVACSHFNMKALPRANEIIKQLAAGSMISLPASAKDLRDDEVRRYLDRYLAGSGATALERIKVFNLAWDAVSSEVGQRYELYDRFSRGDPTIMWAKMYEQFGDQTDQSVRMVRRLLDEMEP